MKLFQTIYSAIGASRGQVLDLTIDRLHLHVLATVSCLALAAVFHPCPILLLPPPLKKSIQTELVFPRFIQHNAEQKYCHSCRMLSPLNRLLVFLGPFAGLNEFRPLLCEGVSLVERF